MEQDSCEHSITEKEIVNSLKQLHNGKALGRDGLPPDYYNKKTNAYIGNPEKMLLYHTLMTL